MKDIITLSHGNGGQYTSDLLEETILPAINMGEATLDDGAEVSGAERIVISTDSFVIDPYFFAGGDIGKLSVCGTVNDLLVCGAFPKYLTLSLILEEGFKIEDLKTIMNSIGATAKRAGVQVVTGDTKVVEKGHGHGIYINTCGIGFKRDGLDLGTHRIKCGDIVLVSGNLGDHGASIFCTRNNMEDSKITSDCAPLNDIIGEILKYGEEVKILRDPTRGGLATTLNEFVEGNSFAIELEENKIPVDSRVKALSELLGLDPLYTANEGKVVAVVSPQAAEEIIAALKQSNLAPEASIIGRVNNDFPGRVILKSELGGRRFIDKLLYDMLPRIC